MDSNGLSSPEGSESKGSEKLTFTCYVSDGEDEAQPDRNCCGLIRLSALAQAVIRNKYRHRPLTRPVMWDHEQDLPYDMRSAKLSDRKQTYEELSAGQPDSPSKQPEVLVVNNLVYLAIVVGLSCFGMMLLWARNRDPVSPRSSVDRFHDKMQALAPPDPGGESETQGLSRRADTRPPRGA